MRKFSKFNIALILSLLFMVSSSLAEEVKALFLGFNPKTGEITVATKDGRKENLKLLNSPELLRKVKELRPGYLIQIEKEGERVTKLKIEEIPQ